MPSTPRRQDAQARQAAMRQYDMALCRAATEHKSRDALKEKVHACARIAVSRHSSGVEVRGFVQRLVDICGDPMAVKENLLFVVDSIMRHAEKEDEHVAKKFERAIAPHLFGLFRWAVQREDTRSKVSTYLLKKLVPVWKENAWFSREMPQIARLLVSGLKSKTRDSKVQDDKVPAYSGPIEMDWKGMATDSGDLAPNYDPFMVAPSEARSRFDGASDYTPSIAPKDEFPGVRDRDFAYQEPPVSAAYETPPEYDPFDRPPTEVPVPTETPTISAEPEDDLDLPVGFRSRFSKEDSDRFAADTPLISGAETPRGVRAANLDIRPPTEEVPSSRMATISSISSGLRRSGVDDDEEVPVPTEAVPTEMLGDFPPVRGRAKLEPMEVVRRTPTSPAPSTPRRERHVRGGEEVPLPTSPVDSPDDGYGREEVPLPTSPAPSEDDGFRRALPGEDEVPIPTSPVDSPHDRRHGEEVPLPTSPVESPHARRGRDDQEIPLPTSPVTSPGEEDDRYAVPVSAQPGSYHSESDGPTESPSVELPVPSEVRPTSEAPSYEEIEILLDEAAMRAEVGTEEIIPLSSSLPHSSAPPRDSSTEPTSPNMVPTQVPSPTEIGGDDPTVPFPTLTRQPATVEPRRAAPEVPVPQVSSSGQMSSGLISSAFVSSPTEMPMPTELLSPTSIGDEDFEDETSVPTVVRTAEPAVMQAPVVTPLQGERPSSPTEVMEDQMTVEAPTMLHPLPEVQMSGSGSLITTGLQSSSVPPASPTEMPVPTDMPSPTEEGDLDYREEATVQPVLQVQSSAIITSTSQVHSSSGHPGSPTELPVPTDLPSPTEEGDVDYVDEATLPPPREPTEAVTSTMPSSLSRPPSSTVSRRRQPGVAPSSPGDVPVPTARPSPTSPGHLEEEAIMGPLPAFSSALLPGSSVPSPSDMPVPTYVPSPTEDIHLDLPTESVPVDQVREPTDSIPSEPTRTMPTRTLPTAPTARPTIPTVAQRRRGAPSSPADLPVPTQMPSPSAAFRDEEEDLRPLPPSGAYSSGKLMSSGFSSRAPVTPLCLLQQWHRRNMMPPRPLQHPHGQPLAQWQLPLLPRWAQ